MSDDAAAVVDSLIAADSGTADVESPDVSESSIHTVSGDVSIPSDASQTNQAGGANQTGGARPDVSSPVIDPRVAAMAKGVGFSDDDIASFANTEALDRTLTLLSSRFLESQFAQQQQVGGLAPQNVQQPSPQPMQQYSQHQPASGLVPQHQAPTSPQAKNGYEFAKEFLESGYDEVVHTLKGMNDHYNQQFQQFSGLAGQIQAIQSQWHQMQQQAAAEQNRRALDWFERQLGSLCEEYHPYLGKGASGSLDEKGKELQERIALAKHWSSRKNLMAYSGLPIPSDDELLKESLQILYGKKLNESANQRARETINQQLKNQSKSVVGQPGSVLGRVKSSRDEAAEKVQAILDRPD